MITPFESIIIHLEKLGFFELLPLILTSAVFYGLLRKSKLFGKPEENVTINATIAVVAAFMVWAYPFLSGVSLHDYELMFSKFFFNSLIATLTVMIALMLADMFAPEGLSKYLSGVNKKFWVALIVFAVVTAIVILIYSVIPSSFLNFNLGSGTLDLIYSIVTLVILLLIVALIVWYTGREEKKKTKQS